MLAKYTTMRPHLEAFLGAWVPSRPDKKSTTSCGSKTEGGFVTIRGNNCTAADRRPLVITYHPKNIDICNILLRNYSILGMVVTQKSSFTNRHLKHSEARKTWVNNLPPDSQLKIGIFPCNRLDCGTCPFILLTPWPNSKGTRTNEYLSAFYAHH